MIMERGTATTDAEIIAEYCQFVTTHRNIQSQHTLRELFATPVVLCKRIGKPILEWTDEEIQAVFATRSKRTAYFYQCFLIFLYFRGYRRASISLAGTLNIGLGRHWTSFVAPYRLKVAQAQQELGYSDPNKGGGSEGTLVNLLLLLLICTGKALEKITRADFEAFAEEYQGWYLRTKSPSGHTDSRVGRIERFLTHWRIIPHKFSTQLCKKLSYNI